MSKSEAVNRMKNVNLSEKKSEKHLNSTIKITKEDYKNKYKRLPEEQKKKGSMLEVGIGFEEEKQILEEYGKE